jgi:hypothetical protein
MRTSFNLSDIPTENFDRLFKAVKDCPKTAEELEEKTKKEEERKKQADVQTEANPANG